MNNKEIQRHLGMMSDFLNVLFIFAFGYSLLWLGHAFGF